MKERASEYILLAAIKLNNDLFTGPYHGACLAKMKSGSQQGFITNHNRFVDRKEAFEIAIASGQTITKHNPKDILLSEDLREDKLFNH